MTQAKPPPGSDEKTTFLTTKKVKRRRYFSGWRFGVISCAVSVILVFWINLITTISVAKHNGLSEGQGVLHEGSCTDVRNLNVITHLVINILSTVLLSGSNYCMQCLSAPTRQEIDREHAKRNWLDIGVLSTRNLGKISRKRLVLWCGLGLTSLPLHLFYNSVLYTSLSANDYLVIPVNNAFTRAGPFIAGSTPADPNHTGILTDLHLAAVNGSLERLDSKACVEAYAQDYLSTRSNLLLVSDDESDADQGTYFGINEIVNTNLLGSCAIDPYAWICPTRDCAETCHYRLSTILKNPTEWRPYGVKVAYCLSQTTPEHCKLEFSTPILIVVLIFNFAKAVLMCCLAFGISDSPLMTLGDAIASFTETIDPTTKGCCLFSKTHFDSSLPGEWDSVAMRWTEVRTQWDPVALQWAKTRVRWAGAASRPRWVLCALFWSTALTISTTLLILGITSLYGPKSLPVLIQLGLGSANVRTVISWGLPKAGPLGLIANILVANLAQPVLSFLYFTYNALFTCMLSAREWNSFATQRKGLRISGVPEGAQRSTYFLQLPYRFALPIMLCSTTLHWLVSQSIFLVAVQRYTPFGVAIVNWKSLSGDPLKGKEITCGYSPFAILCVIFLALVMMAVLVGFASKRYTACIPVVGSCSMAISAACHGGDSVAGGDLATSKLQWGVTSSPSSVSSASPVGHCAFSSRDVGGLVEGCLYAGSGSGAGETGKLKIN